MLDQAFSPVQRKNAQIQSLRAKIEQTGSNEFLKELNQRLYAGITAEAAELLFRNYHFDPNARSELYEYFHRRLKALKMGGSFDDWRDYEDDVLAAAERLWRDQFLSTASNNEMLKRKRNRKSGEFFALALACNYSRILLKLYIEARLYRYVAYLNENTFLLPTQESSFSTGSSLREYVKQTVANYREVRHAWNRELKAVNGASFFRFDAQMFRILYEEFRSTPISEASEWVSPSEFSSASDEFRYQRFQDLRRASFTTLARLPLGVLLYILWLTTGYGMRPSRYFGTGVVTVVTVACLFFANDYFNPGIGSTTHYCSRVAADMPWYTLVLRYLYLAITNLASLGSDPSIAQYCSGTATQLLLILTALTGYFLLAILAAVIFQLISQAFD